MQTNECALVELSEASDVSDAEQKMYEAHLRGAGRNLKKPALDGL